MEETFIVIVCEQSGDENKNFYIWADKDNKAFLFKSKKQALLSWRASLISKGNNAFIVECKGFVF